MTAPRAMLIRDVDAPGRWEQSGLTPYSETSLAAANDPVTTSEMIIDEDFEARLNAGADRIAASRWKRVIDIAGSLFGLVALSPVFIVVGLLIRLETKGPAIFRQRRSGLRGNMFVIYKFRSMRVLEDGDSVVQATKSDDRITKVGAVIRRMSVDELPQLLNVLKGEMSLVGPRPHALAHDDYYSRAVPQYNLRFLTKPGLTGLAQVTGLRGRTENPEDMAKRVASDLSYIQSWSLLGDIVILIRTVCIVAFQSSAY
jgi:putative colanic acid biosynthesis UDP-glucose lipid carrier transferase